MQIAFHIGAFGSESEHQIKILRDNPDILDEQAEVIATPEDYGSTLRDHLVALRGGPANMQARHDMLTSCLGTRDPNTVDRLVISQRGLLIGPDQAITSEGFYTAAAARVTALANLFPEDEVEFHFSILNPVLMLDALCRKRDYQTVMAGLSPDALTWSPVVSAMAAAAGHRPFTLWCNEDLPFVMPEVARAIGDVPADAPLLGDDVMLETLLTPKGLTDYRAQIRNLAPTDIGTRRAITADLLEHAARAPRLSQEITLPDWTEDMIDYLTDLYDDDCALIRTISGVRFITV